MSFTTQRKQPVLATAAVQPSLLQQVGMAGAAAVITVTFIHPIDVVKVRTFHQCPTYMQFLRNENVLVHPHILSR